MATPLWICVPSGSSLHSCKNLFRQCVFCLLGLNGLFDFAFEFFHQLGVVGQQVFHGIATLAEFGVPYENHDPLF